MPNNWKTYKLAEIGDVVTGKTPSSKHPEDFGDEFAFVTPTDFGDYHKSISNAKRYLSQTGVNRLKNKLLPNNSVIVTCIGSDMGKVAINKIPCVTNQQINSIKIDKEFFDVDYIYYYLNSIYDYLKMLAGDGTTMPIINKGRFEEIEIKAPRLKEQIQIANILSVIDDKIENNLATNKTLEDMAMALYKHWFVDFGPFQDGEFVDSELGLIPKGWEVKSVKDFGDTITGKTPSKKFPEHFGNEMPFVTPTDFKNYGKHILDANRSISKLGIEKHQRNIIPVNSIIVTCIGSDMGKVAISKASCLTNQQINSLKCNNYHYMYCFFVYNYSLLKRLAGDGTTMPIINKSTFEAIEILYPGEVNLNNFECQLNEFDEQILINSQENQTLTKLRDTLLPKLISGEVRLKEFRAQVETII
ncbi:MULTISPECIES: restriction endonuclease subunit S [Winogradskyella]|uniref:restriction endonuclease subunit S n=1 Tax=Winogradskyella TaxID=286104 RepID=UPI0015C7342A|nr:MULTISPECIES: restriction endonuclease subunit S [Winogradskyella]QXP78304.1 restriction endonuclease subunit S [Winogradskyella sp. HaHa_3_26]